MNRLLASVAVAAVLLAGCSSGGGDATAPTAPATTATSAPAGATGGVDCSVYEKDGIATFIIWTQLFMQVRQGDGLQTLSLMGYTPDAMTQMLDSFDQLKGIEGSLPGTPDEALANFRKANDIFAAAIAKGDAVSDADFAGLDDIYPDSAAWISAQSQITDALNVACPDLPASS